ncbi:MAG TPA: LysR family transcriptional regulator [Ramlibacter sp.]|nr:LysR family transcriptional regulator [Ramlibacter sp.]
MADMDRLWAVEVFVRVPECGSFSRAADSLNLASGTVTASVRNLERNLNVALMAPALPAFARRSS